MNTQEIPPHLVAMVASITAMAVEITNAGRYHVFTSFSGHVRNVHVHAHRSNAVYVQGIERERLIDMTGRLGAPDAEQELKDIITAMEILQ